MSCSLADLLYSPGKEQKLYILINQQCCQQLLTGEVQLWHFLPGGGDATRVGDLR